MRQTKKQIFYPSDYKSNDGMLTTIWGPPMWHYLHTMSFNYPVSPSSKDKAHYSRFIKELPYVLPCGKCRKNLSKTFLTFPLINKHMQSRETFSKYMYDLHERINDMLGKRSGLSYEDIRDRYEHFRARCATKTRRIVHVREKGCTEPLTGEKSKCILKIVPKSQTCNTFEMDPKCEKVRIVTEDSMGRTLE